MSFKSFNGHYMMSRDSVTGHKDCHSSHLMFIIWCHAFQYLVIKFVIEVIHWSLYVMWFSNLSSRLSFMSFNGHYMMSCDSVTGHKYCHSIHSMVIIWCHAFQYLVIKFVIEVIHWSLYVMCFSNLSSRLSFMSFNGHYMMSCDSVAGHKYCHSSHSMVIIRCHALQ